MEMFLPRRGYLITPLLMYVTVAVFAAMVVLGHANIFSPGSEVMLKWGANYRPLTLAGEPWRLLSACFLHFGIVHLFMNMYALVYVGVMLEPLIRPLRFLVAYLVTGIAASAVSLAWHDNTISAGASGAVFGMYGVFLALLTTNLVRADMRGPLLQSMLVFVVYNLAFGLVPGIDNAAHIGGLLSGMAVGYLYVPSLQRPRNVPLYAALLAVPLMAVLIGANYVLQHTSNDMGAYQDKLKRFDALQEQALKPLQQKGLTDAQVLERLTTTSIPLWQEATQLVQDADVLNISKELHQRDKLILHYCALRLQWMQMIQKALQENSVPDHAEMDRLNAEISKILEQLNKARKN